MKINKEMLSELTKKSDCELWETVRGIASRYGIRLPEKTPSREEMSNLRSALGGSERINLSRAMEILNSYRRGTK